MTENERIRQLRKFKGLTLEQFGSLIGMRKSSISDIENGRRTLTEQTRILICHEFGVSEEWLCTGKGEMFVESDTFGLDKYAAERGATEPELAIVKAYFSLPPDVRAKMLSALKNLLNSVDAIPGAASPAESKNTLREEVDKYPEWIAEK